MVVSVYDEGFKRKLKKMRNALNSTRPVYVEIGGAIRDYIRQTISFQGRGRQWAPLSQWTKARTGRRKALITLGKYFGYDATDKRVHVRFYEPPDANYGILMFHEGFVSRAVSGSRMVVPSYRGGVLATFNNRKPSKIPARKIWPTQKETTEIVRPIMEKWLNKAIDND